jgi:SRSO17 transposase
MTPDSRKRASTRSGGGRQYSGPLGQTANGQVAVSLPAASTTGRSPLGFRLYWPQLWTEDPERLRKAGVPEGVSFQEKWRLALALVDPARGWG